MKKKQPAASSRATKVKKTIGGRSNGSPKKTVNVGSNGSSKKTATVESKGMHSTQLMKLFENELKDIYWAEKAMSDAFPKMIRNATSDELVETLTEHHSETGEHIDRLEQVFEIMGKKAVARKCEAMAGLLKEADTIMNECSQGPMRDAGIILAAQKVEHYEIASYGTLRQFAKTLNLDEAADLLQTSLEEEKAVDEKLTEIAIDNINSEANDEEEEMEMAGTKKSYKSGL